MKKIKYLSLILVIPVLIHTIRTTASFCLVSANGEWLEKNGAFLLSIGGDIRFEDVKRTPIEWALEKHDAQKVAFLLRHGETPNGIYYTDTFEKGTPFLQVAIAEEDFISAKILLDAGANPCFIFNMENASASSKLKIEDLKKEYPCQNLDL
jgi:hypothetical protein